MNIIETERLILRTWKEEDVEPYYQINQDLKVLEYLPGPMTMEQAQHFIHDMNKQWEKRHYTLWAAEEKASGDLMGFIGLSLLDLGKPFIPSVEIGWRLGSDYWGQGYATEGAKAALDYGFNTCQLEEIVAITVMDNKRSQRVMEKIGLKRDARADFKHPRLPARHRLSKHIFYRLRNPSL